MSDDIGKLNDEIELGNKAYTAYESYIKDHIYRVTLQLFEEFSNESVENTARIMEIKRLQAALKGLEVSIKNDIDTGKMASIQLEMLNKGKYNGDS